MRLLVLFIVSVLLTPVVSADEKGPLVNIFYRKIYLPDGCSFYARPSILSKETIRFICDSDDERWRAWVLFTKFDSETFSENPKNPNSFKYKESKLGDLKVFRTKFNNPNHATLSNVVVAFCDHEVCLTFSSIETELLSEHIKSQLIK